MKTKGCIFAVLFIFAILLCFAGCSMERTVVYQESIPLLPDAEQLPEIPTDVSNAEFKVSFLGCGDNIIYGGNTRDARLKAVEGGRFYNFKPQYAKVEKYISSADIAFINQETPMCGDGYDISYYPRFNSPQDLGHDLVELGFDVINIANNHMLDQNSDGLSRTIEFLKGLDVLMIGGYENSEDFDNIRVIKKNQLRIAFISYTYETNGLRKSQSSELVVPYINDDDIKRQAEIAKNISDFVIASVHWGNEGAFKPSNEQKRVAQLFADCGVDVIIGHHPHVLQPIEWLTGEEGNETLCVYSLGNFLAEQDYDYNTVGGMISFDIVSRGSQKTKVENVLFTPTVCHYPATFRENIIYPMTEYTPELAGLHAVKNYYKNTYVYDKLINYVTDTIDEQYLSVEFKEKFAG
ncbi:MAG: CapA family protein [Clostridia bacterium]|nr:CapA family protein [Clostridia bacterium]